MKKTAKYALGALSLFAAAQASAISVTTSSDSTALVNSILGSGITVTSPIGYQGSATSAGLFTDGSVIGIESGIILTSGNAASAVGPNNAGGTTTNFGGAGNPNLDALIPQSTHDATTLSFDFTTDSGDLFFNYVFASEEYNEYVNSSFNDVFAFFVDGVNVAIAPDGNPVSINNVNCGNPYSGTGPNCDSYVNNSPAAFDIEYDGFSQVFTASVLGLSAGSHTMEFSIADAGDFSLDSAVFIAGSSFSSNNPDDQDDDQPSTDVPEPASLSLLALALMGFGFSRKKKIA